VFIRGKNLVISVVSRYLHSLFCILHFLRPGGLVRQRRCSQIHVVRDGDPDKLLDDGGIGLGGLADSLLVRALRRRQEIENMDPVPAIGFTEHKNRQNRGSGLRAQQRQAGRGTGRPAKVIHEKRRGCVSCFDPG